MPTKVKECKLKVCSLSPKSDPGERGGQLHLAGMDILRHFQAVVLSTTGALYHVNPAYYTVLERYLLASATRKG
jgi:hypothetical protein